MCCMEIESLAVYTKKYNPRNLWEKITANCNLLTLLRLYCKVV